MTSHERNRRYEDRRRSEGQVRVTVWAKDDGDAQKIRDMASDMLGNTNTKGQ